LAPIEEKMRVSRIKRVGHVQRRAINAHVRKSNLIQVKKKKKAREKPKITLVDVVKKDLLTKEET
jgi:hypothetical protein